MIHKQYSEWWRMWNGDFAQKSYTLNLFPVVLFIFRLSMFVEWVVLPEGIGRFMTHIIKNIITNIDLSCFSIKTNWSNVAGQR